MILALFAITFIANGIYLVLFRTLMAAIEERANEYWQRIGSPRGLDANASTALLSHLFRRELTQQAKTGGFEGLLVAVRVALSVGLVLTSATFGMAIYLLEARGSAS